MTLASQVTLFRGNRRTTPLEQLPLGTMLARIQGDTYKQRIEAMRAMLARGDAWGTDGYKKEKALSPSFTPCCAMSTRAKAAKWPEKLISTTGIVHFDLDDVDDPEAVKAQLARDPRVCFTFLSPSARGVKVGVAADGITGPDDYKTVWAALLAEFQRRYPAIVFNVDENVKYLHAMCYISYDPQMYVNPEAVPFVMPPPAPTTPKKARALPSPSTGEGEEARVMEALRYIQQVDDYDTWVKVGMCLHSTGEGWARDAWDAWSSGSEKYEPPTQEETWQSFDAGGKLKLGTLFKMAQDGGYTTPHRKATYKAPTYQATVPMMGQAAPAGDPPEGTGTPAAAAAGPPVPEEATWWGQLLLSAKKIPLENISNLLLILENHEHWHDRFWFDTVRSQPMLDDVPIDDAILVEIARWFGLTIGMPLYYIRRLENCVRAVCQKTPRDLLTAWLLALPPWDKVERLTEWLSDVASVPKTTYSMELSRLIPVSMVARALNPGCQYRYVVILEGAEDSGKSKLVRTLASPEWYREFAVSMDNKEAHMLLQGAWVAELGELASLSRTEEAKLKSFITLEEDVWIPKYSNFPQHAPRRTVFLGTVNPEEPYLRGQTGNTRFLPIKTGAIECADLEAMREQLFAEALVYFKEHPDTWWRLSPAAEQEAQHQREARRQASVFEDDLATWLETRQPVKDIEGKNIVTFTRGVTTWEEIAQYYLRIEKEKWKDRALQMQIAQALRAQGWENVQDRQRGTRQRYWRQRASQPVPTLE